MADANTALQDADAAFTETNARITQALVAATRAVSAISAEDLPFHRSLSPSFARRLDDQHARLLALAEQLLANAAAGTSSAAPKIPDEDALEGAWRGIVDVVDGLLERADMCLDEYKGVLKRPPQVEGSKDTQQGQGSAVGGERTGLGSRSKVPRYLDIPKPQLQFAHPPDNHAKDAFRPLLTKKPHATVPLEAVLKRRSPMNIHTSTEQYVHPYKTEIEAYEYPSFVRETAEPIPYKSFEDTQATWVDTEEAMNEMIEELKSAKEVAVDLEHHETRSYIGLVSLMQISTREKDWIVDTLQPWRRKLEQLNEVFTDPSILKVFHGSQSDVVWLQRDLGLYLVGLFDTYHACRALKYPGASLAFLLRKFIDFEAQKQYQLADWRIRPIPQEMLDYARSDTHFLLYIYDNLRNELIANSTDSPDGDLIKAVQQGSKEFCILRYENPIYDAERGLGFSGWYRILSRTPALFTKEQFSVFRAAHAWRDAVARKEDESLNYVMPNHMLFNVARDMPTDKTNMFKVIAPMSQVVRLRVDELVEVVKNAKEKAPSEPEMITIMEELNRLILESKPTSSRPAPQTKGAASATSSTIEPPAASKLTSITQSFVKRLMTSTLWGSAVSKRDYSTKARKDVTLDLPLPNLTAEVFDEVIPYLDDKTESAFPAEPAAKPEHTYVPAADRKNTAQDGLDDVFVVKELGGKKRKRTAATGSTFADGEDEMDISGLGDADEGESAVRRSAKKRTNSADVSDGERARIREARKLAKKEWKKAEKARKAAETGARSPYRDIVWVSDDERRERAVKKAARIAAKKEKEAIKQQKRRAKAELRLERKDERDRAADEAPEMGITDILALQRRRRESIEASMSEILSSDASEDSGSNSNAQPEAPFDYAAAPSLLTGSATDANAKKRKGGKGAPPGGTGLFDVYGKGLNAPKGLGRSQKERAGKSSAFYPKK